MSRRRGSGRIQKYVNRPPSSYGEPHVDLSGLAYHGPEDPPFRPLPPHDEPGWFDTRFSHTPPADDYDNPLRHGPTYGHDAHADHSSFDPTRRSLHLNERNFGPMPQRPPWERTVEYDHAPMTPTMTDFLFRRAITDERYRQQTLREEEAARAISRLPQWDWQTNGPLFERQRCFHSHFDEPYQSSKDVEPIAGPHSSMGLDIGQDPQDQYSVTPGPEGMMEEGPNGPPSMPEPLDLAAVPQPAFDEPQMSLEHIVKHEAPAWEPPPDPFEQMAQQFDQQMHMMDSFNGHGPMM